MVRWGGGNSGLEMIMACWLVITRERGTVEVGGTGRAQATARTCFHTGGSNGIKISIQGGGKEIIGNKVKLYKSTYCFEFVFGLIEFLNKLSIEESLVNHNFLQPNSKSLEVVVHF